ncbi:UbiA prenyltransferase family-domain-containing protein [Schizophyllum commune]
MLYSISLTQSLIHGLHSLPTFSTEAAGFLYTLFLFMKSDVTTTIVPAVRTLQSLTQGSLADNEHSQVALGVSLVGIPTASAFLEGLLWLALHLLAFDIIGLDEDRLSKPHRPIAAGRISLQAAQILHLLFSCSSLLLSARYGLLPHSAVYLACAAAYNDGNLARFWASKSAMIGIGLGICCWGTVVCFNQGRPLAPAAIHALVIVALLLATTVHAQDFRDVAGDAAIGRTTLPMVLPPSFARSSLAVLLVSWSTTLVHFWELPAGVAGLLYALAGTTALLFIRGGTEKADQDACWWYNMWFTACLSLPVFQRLQQDLEHKL